MHKVTAHVPKEKTDRRCCAGVLLHRQEPSNPHAKTRNARPAHWLWDHREDAEGVVAQARAARERARGLGGSPQLNHKGPPGQSPSRP